MNGHLAAEAVIPTNRSIWRYLVLHEVERLCPSVGRPASNSDMWMSNSKYPCGSDLFGNDRDCKA